MMAQWWARRRLQAAAAQAGASTWTSGSTAGGSCPAPFSNAQQALRGSVHLSSASSLCAGGSGAAHWRRQCRVYVPTR